MLIDSGSMCNIINTEYNEKLIQLEDGNETEADFLVLEGTATPRLSKATAESLGLLKVGVCHVTGSDAYNDDVVRRFPNLWKGIGSLKGVQAMLHIDNTVPPVAQ